MPVDSSAFVKPSFEPARVNEHGNAVGSAIVHGRSDIQAKPGITTRVLFNEPPVDKNNGITIHPAKVYPDTFSLGRHRNEETALIPSGIDRQIAMSAVGT